ncbi:uncharacterized protein srcap isoform X3 [Ctenopharyngodon idella]|uniref:uncharacterized protein srcap isoform X3 n=1 Tax=Ctenopharyngodon idella TaxID=7959 RepID=UPI00222F86BC|nr:uncharacterized protein srcap isoform X3 [Ctenopharyngodon idella]
MWPGHPSMPCSQSQLPLYHHHQLTSVLDLSSRKETQRLHVKNRPSLTFNETAASRNQRRYWLSKEDWCQLLLKTHKSLQTHWRVRLPQTNFLREGLIALRKNRISFTGVTRSNQALHTGRLIWRKDPAQATAKIGANTLEMQGVSLPLLRQKRDPCLQRQSNWTTSTCVESTHLEKAPVTQEQKSSQQSQVQYNRQQTEMWSSSKQLPLFRQIRLPPHLHLASHKNKVRQIQRSGLVNLTLRRLWKMSRNICLKQTKKVPLVQVDKPCQLREQNKVLVEILFAQDIHQNKGGSTLPLRVEIACQMTPIRAAVIPQRTAVKHKGLRKRQAPFLKHLAGPPRLRIHSVCRS